ncbi:Peptidase A1 domain-containing protein [Caenorhabditis elegans]|uniref:Peptidase A1 domain-containing protein n=1 Tax=Caenorhabditis elegans TaxID=6239 RepID=O16338_CAEEL|nr:Peptidase A1 domain-containing protein [Caenorhabditis elegans]CCD67830.2 Peptidase A1 domain-containing protein [Caenorhabditis elegans]|eukprot:NP_503825.2 ASpartyl Protease [Caenorhabditis elegans]
MFGKLISLLGLVALCSAGQFSISVEKSGSLREQLIREGRYGQELARIQQLSTGNVSFFDHFDEYYTAGVRIGTPAQHFQVAFDTTSSNLWVFGVECRSQNCHGGRGRRDREYNRTASSTFVAGTSSFNLPYDGGHVSGNVGKDTAQFAGFTIQSQDFGIGTAATRLFGETFDGVLGLGWPATALNGTSTTMQNLLPQLDQKLFTTYFTKSNMHNGTAGGDIMFGAIDTTHCQSQVNYVPLAYNSFWSYSVDGFSIGTYSRTQTETTIPDTSSGWTGVPNVVLAGIVKATGATYDWNHQAYTLPCSSTATLPDMVFTIGGNSYNVRAVEYVVNLNLPNGQCALSLFGTAASQSGPAWILGDNFLRSYCHVFDFGNSRIGLAKAIQNY